MIYFLSDAHLGSLAIEKGWAHQQKLIDMLEMMSKDAESIYMLGDMFDFWMEYFIHDKRKRQYQPFCREVRKLAFAAEFDDTPEETFKPDTHYRELDEWGSLVALSIISMVDDEMDKRVTGADLRNCTTIEELYNLVESK